MDASLEMKPEVLAQFETTLAHLPEQLSKARRALYSTGSAGFSLKFINLFR
jgi:hypothetical protein